MNEEYIEEKIGEQIIRFAKPTVRMRAGVMANAKAWKKERYADNLRLAGIDGLDMLPFLKSFDGQRLLPEDFIDYLDDDAGQIDTLEKSLGGYPSGERPGIINSIGDDKRKEITAKLWGLTLVPIEGVPTDPPKPLTETTPAA
jgi:hypothetical protein